jgi:hypothetical protein
MTTPLVLLGLALLAGAIVWVLSIRQTGSTFRLPSISRERSQAHETELPEPMEPHETIEALDLGAPQPELEPEPAPQPFSVPGGRRGHADSFAYVPLAVSDGLDLRTRLIGILGLVAVILLTSAAIAFGLWMLGRGIGLQLSNFAKQ